MNVADFFALGFYDFVVIGVMLSIAVVALGTMKGS
jgi:hypothetical protein